MILREQKSLNQSLKENSKITKFIAVLTDVGTAAGSADSWPQFDWKSLLGESFASKFLKESFCTLRKDKAKSIRTEMVKREAVWQDAKIAK